MCVCVCVCVCVCLCLRLRVFLCSLSLSGPFGRLRLYCFTTLCFVLCAHCAPGYFGVWCAFAHASAALTTHVRYAFTAWARAVAGAVRARAHTAAAAHHYRVTAQGRAFRAWVSWAVGAQTRAAMMRAALLWRRTELQKVFLSDLGAVVVGRASDAPHWDAVGTFPAPVYPRPPPPTGCHAPEVLAVVGPGRGGS